MAEIDICNRALGHINHTERITAIDGSDTSAAALACKDIYATVRDELLAEHDWRFAKRIALLAEADAADYAHTVEWDYAYDLPANCVVPREIWTGERLDRADDRFAFETQASETLDAQVLLCDVAPVTASSTSDERQQAPWLKYTARITDTAAMPKWWQRALSYRLATELATRLTGSAQLAARADQMAAFSVSSAMEIDAKTQQVDPAPDSEFIGARS